MTSRSPQLSLSPFSSPFAVADYTSALSLCCAYARDAAAEGRFLAAHGLYQSAVTYLERAQQMAQRSEECSFHDWSFLDDASDALVAARAELDECAKCIYPEGRAKFASSETEDNLQ
ncbi:hypothetical protein EON83_25675 [bacterium]|nr:MAG: hypothetical protein EON83_25675 [bacterium]